MRTLLVGLVLMLAVQAFAQSSNVEEVKKAAQARDAAAGAGDGEAWGKTVADGFVFTNVRTGEVSQPKKQMIENMNNRGNEITVKIADQKFHAMDGIDNVVWETGRRVAGEGSGTPVVRVWSKQDNGAWQTISVYNAPEEQ